MLKGLVKGKMRIAFISTAANLEDGGKEWLMENFNECRKLGTFDIVDISSVPRWVLMERPKGGQHHICRWRRHDKPHEADD